jgi:hypothetical protein
MLPAFSIGGAMLPLPYLSLIGYRARSSERTGRTLAVITTRLPLAGRQ